MLRLTLQISSGALLYAVALVAAAGQVSGNFDVNIGVTPRPSVCATQQVKGRAGALARVDCLSNALPSLNIPGRSDVSGLSLRATLSASPTTLMSPVSPTAPRLESASQVPATTNLDGLAATAAGPGAPRTAADQDESEGLPDQLAGAGAPGGTASANEAAAPSGTGDDRILRSAVVPISPSQPSVIEVSF